MQKAVYSFVKWYDITTFAFYASLQTLQIQYAHCSTNDCYIHCTSLSPWSLGEHDEPKGHRGTFITYVQTGFLSMKSIAGLYTSINSVA